MDFFYFFSCFFDMSSFIIRFDPAAFIWESVSREAETKARRTFLGDYSIGVPPLPIPNREVKSNNADGTAQAGE